MAPSLHRRKSVRSLVRAWTCYASIGYVSLTITIIGLTLKDLAANVGFVGPAGSLSMFPLYLGRGFGAVAGTLVGGLLCDLLPIKVVMSGCIVFSALSMAVVPVVSSVGMNALVLAVLAIGFCGSALVATVITTAFWSFPGAAVGPVLSNCGATSTVTSTLLPLVFLEAQLPDVSAKYTLVSFCAVPALVLLFMCEAPSAPSRTSKSSASGAKWPLVFATALAQLLLQGAISGLLQWLNSFGSLEFSADKATPLLLVTTFQGCGTLGNLLAAQWQQHFRIWDLALVQTALMAIGATIWLPLAWSMEASFAAVMLCGLVGAPTVTYFQTLLNQHASPSGRQVSLVTLGTNCGANFMPFVIGAAMKSSGPRALIWVVLACFGAIAASMLVAGGWARRSVDARGAGEQLLRSGDGHGDEGSPAAART